MLIDALKAFLAVAASGNFTQVAKAQNVAVSSVTRRVEMLESELGARLFNRSPRRVQLTDAGAQFVPRAQNILAELAEARDAIASVHAEPRGTISVTAPSTFGRRHLAPAVTSFLQRYPLMEVDLHVSDEIVDLNTRQVDVAVRIGVLPDSDLLATRLAPQQRIACASPAYIGRAGRPARPEDLLDHNCLTVSGPAPRVGWWQFAGVNGGRPLRVRGTLRSDDSESLLNAALGGVGIAHLATWLIGDEIAAGRLVALFDDEIAGTPVSASAIHAVRAPGRSVRKARLFIDHLRETFGVADGGVPYWDQRFLDAPTPQAPRTPPPGRDGTERMQG